MSRKMIEYVPSYLRKYACCISIEKGNSLLGCYVLNDDDFVEECKKHNIEAKFTLKSNWGLGMGYYVSVNEITEETKVENPVLCYILKELHKLIQGPQGLRIYYEPGYGTIDQNTEIYTDLDSVVRCLASRFYEKSPKELERLRRLELERLRSTVKFRDDPEYEKLERMEIEEVRREFNKGKV